MLVRQICEAVLFTLAFGLLAVATHDNRRHTFHHSSADFPQATTPALLEEGFRHLYGLEFLEARKDFADYQRQEPDDPWGKAAEAASYLFDEFNDKKVLTSEFFLNDSKFLSGMQGSPVTNQNAAFLAAIACARELAKKRLKLNPKDLQGLLVLTVADGLESAYEALVEKKRLDAIKLMWYAESEAVAVLEVDSSAQDANVALGLSNYVIGSLPSYKRAVLWMGGIHGDRNRGMKQMQSAAEHGHYLRPFARIVLALAYEREGQPCNAKELLAKLAFEFPTNSVFSHELALVDQKSCR